MSNHNGIFMVGRAEQMGLGTMTEEFAQGIQPEKVIVMDCRSGRGLNLDNLNKTGAKVFIEDARLWARKSTVLRHLEGCRYLVGFESFYNNDIVEICRELGIKTVMYPMWEWSPDNCARADIIINLSDTDQGYYPNGHLMDWPISPAIHVENRVKNWPPKTFVHVAGNAKHNRDGSREVLKAAIHLRDTGARLLFYHAFDYQEVFPGDYTAAPIDFLGSFPDRASLYKGMDCMVCPRRFGGHSLPINEASSEHIPTIVLDLPDWNRWPYKVSCHDSEDFTFCKASRRPVECKQANPDELGKLMREMALGHVGYTLGPDFPTWAKYKEDFLNILESL